MKEQFKAWRAVKNAIESGKENAFEMLLDYVEQYGYASTLVKLYTQCKSN